jgi:hypothetical protein
MKSYDRLCLLLLLVLQPCVVFASEFSGPVVSVLDGDTLEVLHNNARNASASRTKNASPLPRTGPAEPGRSS